MLKGQQLGVTTALALLLALAVATPVAASSLALTSPHGMDSLEIEEGTSYEFEVGVHSEGGDLIHIKMSADGSISPHLTFSPTEFDLAPDSSERVKVNISPLSVGTYEGSISATQVVTVEGEGMHTGVSLSSLIKVTVVGSPDDTPEENGTPVDENQVPWALVLGAIATIVMIGAVVAFCRLRGRPRERPRK